MSSANPLPETCHVYLDLSPLPLQSDDSADLVALSPSLSLGACRTRGTISRRTC